jgi:hypothetical protein
VEELDLEQYFNSLTSNKILIGVLGQTGKIEIPISFFTDVQDSQLEVTLNEDQTHFVFSLKSNNE